MRSARFIALAGFSVLWTACPPATQAPACSSGAACPSGQVCLDGGCLVLSELSRSFAAVVVPLESDLLPQEYLGIDPSAGPNDFTLDPPAILGATIPIPAICTPSEALPLQLLVTRHSLLPISSEVFTCTSDLVGTFACPLPASEPIDVSLGPALPCAAPGTQLGQVWFPGPIDPSTFGFLPPAQTLTIIGTLGVETITDGGIVTVDGGIVTTALPGASVTVLAAAGPRAGQPISATVITQPRSAGCQLQDTSCSTVGFVIPVPLDQVLLDGGTCAPPTESAACLLDGGCPFSPCATLILEVGPSAAADGGTLPSIDFLISRQITPADPSAGSLAGPTLSLMGGTQLGIQFPVPRGTAPVEGFALDPLGAPLTGALAELRSSATLQDCLGPPPLVATDATGVVLCAYATRALSLSTGHFAMEAPPGLYSLTISPSGSQPNLAPHESKVTVPDFSPPPLSVETLPYAGVVSGQVTDPSDRALPAGQVRVFPLNSEQLIGRAAIGDQGKFSLPLPPTPDGGVPDLFVFDPPQGLGLAASSKIVSIPSQDLDLGSQKVSVGVPITGSVFARTLDGSRRPLASASVRFYLLSATAGQFVVAVPAATAVTDSVGRYATVVPNVPTQ